MLAAVAAVCPEIEPAAIAEFLGRMDEAYLERHGPHEIALHVRLASEVGAERAARVNVAAVGNGRYDVTVVALDYFGEFSMLCGLLAAHGLSIESGEVHTFCPATAPPSAPGERRRRPPPSTKIVDVFRVAPRLGKPAPDRARMEEELLAVLALVADGRADEARERLNRQLVESLESARGELARTVRPVEIEFDNAALPAWTVMRVRGQDAPAFLHALANALAMRESTCTRSASRARSRGQGRVRDRAPRRAQDRRRGRPAHLRLAIALIKQFTHFLPSAPDPPRPAVVRPAPRSPDGRRRRR
jgi:glutamate-ammonia-ligase adenylyltransferase